MKTPAEIQKDLREILVEGLDLAFKALKNYLPPETDKCKDLLLLEGRYKDTTRQLLQGIISNEDAQLEFNKIRKDLLIFIDCLEEKDLTQGETPTHADGTPDIYNGELLYRIPKTMQVGEDTRCIVRIAFDRQILMQDLEAKKGDVMKDIRISDVMGVELLDPTSQNAFEIKSYSELVQFVEKDLPTEWIFYVKPLLEGTFPLLLKVSVIEIMDGVERKRTVVMEEQVQIFSKAPVLTGSVEEFVSSGYTMNFGYSYTVADKQGREPKMTPPAPFPQTGAEPPPPPQAPFPPVVTERTYAPPPPPSAPVPMQRPGSGLPFRRMAAAMAALVVFLVGAWAIWTFTKNPVKNDWATASAENNKSGYEDFIEKHPGAPQAVIAREKLDSIESAIWQNAVASADTNQIHSYIETYPSGEYVTEALLMLEKGREPIVREVIFSWNLLDTALIINHQGGFAPFSFSFIQNGQVVKQVPRDSIGEFSVPLSDLKPGSYVLQLQDADGWTVSDTMTIQPPKAPADEKKPNRGVTKKTTPKKKKPAPVLPSSNQDNTSQNQAESATQDEQPGTASTSTEEEENANRPVPMKSAARLPVYPGCSKSSGNKEKKCTERKIHSFIDSKLNYPAQAMQKGIQGTVIVNFVVEKDGSITGVSAQNDIGGGCGEEAVRIIGQLPKFKPGLNAKGDAVRVAYTLPISFRLR